MGNMENKNKTEIEKKYTNSFYKRPHYTDIKDFKGSRSEHVQNVEAEFESCLWHNCLSFEEVM